MVNTLFQFLPKENVIGTHIVTTQMHADDLLRMAAAGYGLPYQRSNKATLLRTLESYFRACMEEGKRSLLVVDECQGLPRAAIEELRMALIDFMRIYNKQWILQRHDYQTPNQVRQSLLQEKAKAA